MDEGLNLQSSWESTSTSTKYCLPSKKEDSDRGDSQSGWKANTLKNFGSMINTLIRENQPIMSEEVPMSFDLQTISLNLEANEKIC